MDFFVKHYEKLLLAFCLICLVAGMMLVLLSLDRTRKEVIQNQSKAEQMVKVGDTLEHENATATGIDTIRQDERKQMNVLGNTAKATPKASLLEPANLVVCSNEECLRLLPYTTDVCPFCKTEQPEAMKETAEGHDTDQDGIPDSIEKKYAFLNFRDPTDAAIDYDGDGFTNLEEYKAGSKMDDPESIPRLAILLRCVTAKRLPLGIKLRNIDTNRKEDPAKWDIFFAYADPVNAKKTRTASCTLNEDANAIAKTGFKVVKASIQGEGGQAVAKAVIQNISNPQESYELSQDEEVLSKDITVTMYYLTTRDGSALRRLIRNAITKKVGEEIELVKPQTTDRTGNTEMGGGMGGIGGGMTMRNETRRTTAKETAEKTEEYKERYRIVRADEDSGTCVLGFIDKEGGPVLAETTVQAFDQEKDLKASENRMMDGGGMGMPDDMNRNPRVPAAPRPNRRRQNIR